MESYKLMFRTTEIKGNTEIWGQTLASYIIALTHDSSKGIDQIISKFGTVFLGGKGFCKFDAGVNPITR